jgi:hypothetical protein
MNLVLASRCDIARRSAFTELADEEASARWFVVSLFNQTLHPNG